MGSSERQKELKRRRHRRIKVAHLKKRAERASPSEKNEIARKLRGLTPGGQEVIERLGIEDR